MSAPPSSLLDAELDVLWATVARRLERRGYEGLGRVRLPPLGPSARLTLTSLLGRSPGATVDLGVLEQALARLGVAANLADALGVLGHPVSEEPQRQRQQRAIAGRARDAARATVAQWSDDWARAWIDEIIRAGILRGLDEPGALELLSAARAVLDRLETTWATTTGGAGLADSPRPISRVDLAATLFGDAHALDSGTRLEAAVGRALAHEHRASLRREAWEHAGVHLDLTSAPVLTWALPVAASPAPSGLGALVSGATALGIPIHLSQLALRSAPLELVAGADVLVVENPRVVEFAAQRRSAQAVVSTNGNPSTAVRTLLDLMIGAGAHLRYHGDFDAAGLAICGRLQALGLTPWHMDAVDYQRAVERARAEGVELPVDDRPVPHTPWDPALRELFAQTRRVVHEERLLAELLAVAD